MRDRYPQRRRLMQRATRTAFTLLEVALTLAVMVVIASLTWPTISRVFDTNRLRAAGDQMRAEFGQARSRAMTTGLPHVFRFEPNTANYEISAWVDPCAPVEASLTTMQSAGSSSTLGTAVPQSGTVGTDPTGSSGGAVRTLPQGITFLDIQRSTDSRTAIAEEGLASSGQASTVPPILFYPDGTSSDAVVRIGNDRGRFVEISLRGLTGLARMGEISTTESTTSDGYQMPTFPNGRNANATGGGP